MTDNSEPGKKKPSTSFTVGAIALVFLAIGYQTALFIHKAAVATVVSKHDRPDTVYIYAPAGQSLGGVRSGSSPNEIRSYSNPSETRSNSSGNRAYTNGKAGSGRETKTVRDHAAMVLNVQEKYGRRKYESFDFNPNTATVDELERLGFSEKQAQAIENYRKAGGVFRRKEDFAKSYVVEDSVFQRLEPYIQIPLLDINKADSTAFDALPGIGPYFASKLVSYREKLGGYSYKEQLMDIPKFDEEKFGKLEDLICVSPPQAFRLWTLPEDSLARHPYIDRHAAHSIVLFRDNSPKSEWTVASLSKAGILSSETADNLGNCLIEK